MPEYWYSYRAIDKSDPKAELNEKIVAAYKPYFMTYVYPKLRSSYKKYISDTNKKVRRLFKGYGIQNLDELISYDGKTDEMVEFLSHYETDKKIGTNRCVVNRICHLLENEFPKLVLPKQCKSFDYSILKCDTEYSQETYNRVSEIYGAYKKQFDMLRKRPRLCLDDDTGDYTYDDFVQQFKIKCSNVCPNEQELCDIVLDLCYQSDASKRFAWDVAGKTIIDNLLKKNNYSITFPIHGGNEFEYCGEMFSMMTVALNGEDDIW